MCISYNFVSKKEQTCELTYMDGSNYYNNYKAYMGSVSVPSKTTYNGKTYDVIRIGDNAFNSCSKLDSIRIPKSIESIGYNAFRSCYNLKHVEIPNSVKKIEYGAFAWCKGLATITLPDGITAIESNTFEYCTSLTSITIPSSVSSIGYYAFTNCTSLVEIKSMNHTPPQISQYVFWDNNTNKDCYGATLYVPYKAKKAYASAEYWKKFKKIVEIVKSYRVEYKIDGEVVYVDSVKEGSSISTYTPQKEGYTFNGWKDVPSIMPSNDLVIEGSFTANEYLLSYVVDGAIYAIKKVKCDEKIEKLNLEEKVGYSFVWENWIDKMPPKDYTIRGRYVPNVYNIT